MAPVNFLVLALFIGLGCAQISVNYRVEFNEVGGQCGGTNVAPTSVTVPVYSTALAVMEGAVSQGSAYQFQLDYSPSYAGYIVMQLTSIGNQGQCSWTLYVAAPGNAERRVRAAVDNYYVADNYTVILRYEMGMAMHTTRYIIEYPDALCPISTPIPAVSVAAPMGSTGLEVMERGARANGVRYAFSVAYDSSSSGYAILELDGNKRTAMCSWVAFTVPDGGTEMQLSGSVSDFVIPADNSQLILRFREQMLPTTPAPLVATTGAAEGLSGVSIVVMALHLLALLLFVF